MSDEAEKKPDIKTYPDNVQKEVHKILDQEDLRKKIISELQTDPKYKEYFSKFTSESVESFIKDYPGYKIRYLEYGKMLMDYRDKRLCEFRNEAEEKFWEIQQKKLFNLQCLWRAEKITIQGIEITDDFNYWERNIEKCPFLDPVTEEEVNLYIEYLLSDNYSSLGWFSRWQDYDDIKAAYLHEDEDCEIPDWYEFYDMRKGTGYLMTLPDLRGEKESFYTKLFFEEEKRKKIADGTYKEYKYIEQNRISVWDYKTREEFIKKFESRELLDLFLAYEDGHELSDRNEEVDRAIDLLKYAKEPVPIEPWHDWAEGIIRTAERYRIQQTAKAMYEVFSDYQFRITIGISVAPVNEKNHRDWYPETRAKIISHIIQGRILNGEPGDLIF